MTDFAHSRAVVIGIDHYQHIRGLNTAVNDARRLADCLRAEHGYDDVLLLEDATRATLATELGTQLAARTGKDDRLVLYFAGHGIALDGKDGPEGYLVPVDARVDDRDTFVAMADLYRWLDALPCRHLLVILDCCFAGAFTWYGRRNLAPVGGMLYREHYDRFVREPAWQILTSAAHDQEALDVLGGKPIGARGEHAADGAPHSPFADALFAALQGAGDLGINGQGDGVMTATELYLYLRQTVEVTAEEQANHRQTPELWPFSRTRHGKGEFIFLAPGHGEPLLEPAPELTTANNPYRGLQSYDEKQAALFFGRGALIEKLAAAVDEHPLTVVLGASGTGKSSVVKAGVVPYLRHKENDQRRGAEAQRKSKGAATLPSPAGAATAPDYFMLPPMRPGDAPLRVLVELVTANLPGSTGHTPEKPDPAALIVAAIAGWLAAHEAQRLLLVVDQVEELVTLCRDDAMRAVFLQTLADLLAAHPDRMRVIFTLRTDFEPQFQESPLNGLWRDGRFVVPPMNQAELREVIEAPAAVRVLFFDPPALVDTLIDEVIQTPGALPLLSFTLEQLYLKYLDRQSAAQRDGVMLERSLTQVDYKALGGVIGSLRRRADEIYVGLTDDAYRATMQRVMLRMVAVEGGELARRRVMRTELIYPSDAENDRVQPILDRLVSERLLVTGSMDVDGDGVEDTVVEPAHDALVAAWDKLLQWQRQAEEYLPLQRRLWQAASEWQGAAAERQRDLLWNDNPRLPQLEETLWPTRSKEDGLAGRTRWVRQVLWPKTELPVDTQWLNRVEVAFVQASVKRRASGLRRIIAVTALVITFLALALVFADGQRRIAQENERIAKVNEDEAIRQATIAGQEKERAETEADKARRAQAEAEREAAIARSRELASHSDRQYAQGDYESALLLALESGLISDTPQAFSSIRQVISKRGRPFIYEEGHEAGGSLSPTWFANDRYFLTVGCHQQTGSIDCDGNKIGVKVWAADNGSFVLEYLGLLYAEVIRSPDGSHVVARSQADDAMYAPKVPIILISADFSRISWSADSKRFVALRDGKAYIWTVSANLEPQVIAHPDEEIHLASWNADGSQLLTVNLDSQTILRWVATTGAELGPTEEIGQRRIPPLAPDHLAHVNFGVDHSFSEGSSIRVWDWQGEEIGYFDKPRGEVQYQLWNIDQTRLLIADSAGLIKIWDTSSGDALVSFQSYSAMITQINWSKDGDYALVHGCDRFDESQVCELGGASGMQMWNIHTGVKIYEVENGDFEGYTKWNADETLLLTYEPGTANVRNALNGDILFSMGDVDATWNTDGSKLLAADSSPDNVRVWETDSLAEQPEISLRLDDVYHAEVNPLDNRRLLIAGCTEAKSTASRDCTQAVAQVLEYESGKILWTMDLPLNAAKVGWTENGAEVIVVENYSGHVSFWNPTADAASPTLEYTLMDQEMRLWDLGEAELAILYPVVGKVVDMTTGEIRSNQIDFGGGSNYQPPFVRFHQATDRYISGVCSIVRRGACREYVARVFNQSNDVELRTLFRNRNGTILDGEWNAAGDLFVTAGLDGIARIWNVNTGQQEVSLGGHTAPIVDVLWRKDESQIMTAGRDGTVRIWDVRDGKMIYLYEHGTPVFSASWSKDESQIVVIDTNGAISRRFLHMDDLVDRVCQYLPRNLTMVEWNRYMSGEYRPTCPQATIPLDVIETTKEQIQIQLERGEVAEASQLRDTLNVWLKQSGEYDRFGAMTESTTGPTSLAAQSYEEGATLAANLQIDEAAAKFAATLADDTNLFFDPMLEAKRIAISTLLSAGHTLAKNGELQAATAKFREALVLDQSLPLGPEAMATQTYALTMMEQGRKGNVSGAVVEFIEAIAHDPTLDITRTLSADVWNRICWLGSLRGLAAAVLPSCERAVALSPEDGNTRDSRGLARALTDDLTGAIKDFEFAVQWAKQQGDLEAIIESRTAWIEAMKVGANPFDAATLEQLRNE